MLCTFFIHTDRGFPRRIGPIEVRGRAEVKRLAEIEYARRPDVSAIDIWEDDGALYRMPKTAFDPSQPIPFRITPSTKPEARRRL
jgi:hypothetical protein